MTQFEIKRTSEVDINIFVWNQHTKNTVLDATVSKRIVWNPNLFNIIIQNISMCNLLEYGD